MLGLRKTAKRVWHFMERMPSFFKVALSRQGIFSADGRTLIWGKLRRYLLSLIPGVAPRLQKYYGIRGGCVSCGASCKLLNQCPHWDDQTHLCMVYEDRPNICRTFPITPADIRDRNIVLKDKQCGFKFNKNKKSEF